MSRLIITHSFVSFLLSLSLLFLFSTGTLADSDPIDVDIQPLNATQPLETWVISRKISITNSKHDAYQVGNDSNTISFQLDFTDKFWANFYTLHVKSPEGNFHVKPNTHVEHCGFSQTYKMSNGVQFFLDVRGWNPDRWYIKKSGHIDQKYTFYRHPHAIKGYVKSHNGTNVAHFGTHTFGSGVLSSLIHSKIPDSTTHRIVSNGQVPILELATLFVLAILRVDDCHNRY